MIKLMKINFMVLTLLMVTYDGTCSTNQTEMIADLTKATIVAKTMPLVIQNVSTSSWSSLSSFSEWIVGREINNGESGVQESRTFGKIRRLQMLLTVVPVVFKLGILSTLIFVLVFLGLKTVFLLKILLIMNLGGVLAKLLLWKSESQQHHHPHHGWAPSGWGGSHGKEVHVHIHNDGGHHESSTSWSTEHHHDPYSAYSNNQPVYVEGHRNRRMYNNPPMFKRIGKPKTAQNLQKYH